MEGQTLNHLTRLEISNFKKFDHLIVENIGQVNLITGDNNVGKTTLLEALLFNANNTRWISQLHQTLCSRRIHIHPENLNSKQPIFPSENYLERILSDILNPLEIRYETVGSNAQVLSLRYRHISDLTDLEKKYRKDKYDIANVADWITFYKNGNLDELQWMYLDDKVRNLKYGYLPLITFNASYGQDLERFIKDFAAKAGELDFAEKQNVLSYLKLFIPDVLDYEIRKFGRDSLIGLATESDKSYRALTEYGDGVQKFFRYIVELVYTSKRNDVRFMIDEVDTGVHFLKMKEEWKILFELVQRTGIQLFATTHSLDCIKAFAEAGEELPESRSQMRLIELEQGIKDPTKTFASTYGFETIESALESKVNLRGGNLYA